MALLRDWREVSERKKRRELPFVDAGVCTSADLHQDKIQYLAQPASRIRSLRAWYGMASFMIS